MQPIDKYEFCFKTRKDAEEALDVAAKIIDEFGCCSVADLCDIAGIISAYDDGTRGWDNTTDFIIVYSQCCSDEWCKYRIIPPNPITIPRAFTMPTTTESQPDMVNHPQHYKSETGLEAIDVIEAFTFDLKGIEAVCTGNVLKYVCRWPHKNGLEDLEKAQWYLTRLINHIKKLQE